MLSQNHHVKGTYKFLLATVVMAFRKFYTKFCLDVKSCDDMSQDHHRPMTMKRCQESYVTSRHSSCSVGWAAARHYNPFETTMQKFVLIKI
jgi:hypothetical protein